MILKYIIYNLVAKIFIKDFDNNLYTINHKDNNILNNKLDNIEIVLKKYSKPKINNLTDDDIKANEKEWFLLKNFENYEITKCGLIRNNKTKKLLKLNYDKDGYLSCSLKLNNITKNKTIHRLLAENFIINANNLPTVDHINKNKKDNRLENLRWASMKLQNINKNYNKKDVLPVNIIINKDETFKQIEINILNILLVIMVQLIIKMFILKDI